MFESSACAYKHSRMKGTAMVVHPEILIRRLGPYLQQKNDEAFRHLQIATLSDGSSQLSWKGHRLLLATIRKFCRCYSIMSRSLVCRTK
jgi:hypothetical protein